MRRDPIMRRNSVIRMYKALSEEDPRTFRRWAKANCVVALILAIAFAAVSAGLPGVIILSFLGEAKPSP
jgi:hypothetical protein